MRPAGCPRAISLSAAAISPLSKTAPSEPETVIGTPGAVVSGPEMVKEVRNTLKKSSP